ncbi:hypothetical protein ACIRJR_29560 [Streptomyces sp. NPDC102402]|uniref:hypothetical protein n=1 Tax=Streptomyces sp. NPDC102402 TaxID=3366169 RepID=UPI0037F97FA4
MDRTAGSGGAGMTVGSCLFRGCVTVLGLCLALVVWVMIWMSVQPGRNEDTARADMRAGAESRKELLALQAADGRLTDTEIASSLGGMGKGKGRLAVDRDAGSIRITTQLEGVGPGFLLTHETITVGCYVFDVTPRRGGKPRVAMRETEREMCRSLPWVSPSLTPAPTAVTPSASP